MWLEGTDEWIDYSFTEAKTGKYILEEIEQTAYNIDLLKEAIYGDIIEDIIEPIIKKINQITYRDWLSFVVGCFVCSWFWFGLVLGWWP